jgi:hypothetical protein
MRIRKKSIDSDRWPSIENKIGIHMPGVIRRASVRDLLKIGDDAKKNGWSSAGRPLWTVEHSSQIRDLFITVLSEDRGFLRCSVTAVLTDGTGGHFSLDMSRRKFDELPDLSQEELVTLAFRYFKMFRNIPLDADQQAEWDKHAGGQGAADPSQP